MALILQPYEQDSRVTRFRTGGLDVCDNDVAGTIRQKLVNSVLCRKEKCVVLDCLRCNRFCVQSFNHRWIPSFGQI